MSDNEKTSILVIYAEPQLQKTSSYPADWTVRQAIAEGQKELESHLNSHIQGLSTTLEIDPDCTDFFPGGDLDAKLSSLEGLKAMICWPKGPTDQTPSPLYDVLIKPREAVSVPVPQPVEPPIQAGETSTQPPAPPVIPTIQPGASAATAEARLAILEQKLDLQEQLVRGMTARITLLENQLEAYKKSSA